MVQDRFYSKRNFDEALEIAKEIAKSGEIKLVETLSIHLESKGKRQAHLKYNN